MYCKHCGKEIDADSRFCKHCGKDLQSVSNAPQVPKASHGFLSRFLSLSKKWQIILMIFILWVLAWICGGLLSNHDSEEVGAFILFVVAIPIFILFIWHFFKHLRGKKKVEPLITNTYSLVDFANEHGRMQMVKDYNKKTCSYDIYFTFIDNDGHTIKVQPTATIKDWETEQISIHKHSLQVNEYNDGHYDLTSNQQLCDIKDGVTFTSQDKSSQQV